ncbi:hypothetical protein FRC01_001751 [Tulasnella sp. 417]|nr:hypothetical protein FRC01_001751 [Tulasnella sp. 417]
MSESKKRGSNSGSSHNRKIPRTLEKDLIMMAERLQRSLAPLKNHGYHVEYLECVITKILNKDPVTEYYLGILGTPIGQLDRMPSNSGDVVTTPTPTVGPDGQRLDFHPLTLIAQNADVEREQLIALCRSALDSSDRPSNTKDVRVLLSDRRRAIKNGIQSPAPRHSAKNFLYEQRLRAMQIGRPFETTGPPVVIYHDVFLKFKSLINKKGPDPESEDVATALDLMQIAAEGYADEQLRVKAMMPKIEKLLKRLGMAEVPTLIVEANNEVGTGGCDPGIRGAYSFRKLWASVEESVRDASCCPSFILSVTGPHLTIHGGILTTDFIVQPLTETLGLANFPDPYGRARYIARVMVALRPCLKDLETFYDSLDITEVSEIARLVPATRRYGDFTLTYTSGNLQQDRIGRAMFDAKAKRDDELTETLVKVKFTPRYCREAHELLAENGLAPRLLHYEELGGDWVVAVMEAGGNDLASQELSRVPDRALKDIKAALALLHGKNLVFGDFRRPNILLCHRDAAGGGVEEGAMLIDFDWVGKDGEQKYLPRLNSEIQWPEGVEGGKVMRKEHDDAMFALLASL